MHNTPSAVMVFAAGFGTRMAPLSDTRPKPLINVAGKTLLDHALDLTVGFEPVVVNCHYLASQIQTHTAGRPIQTMYEDTLLDTGGGLKNALPVLGNGPVFTLNSDAVWHGANVLRQLLLAWDSNEMDALLAVVPVDRAKGHNGTGDFEIKSGRLNWGGPMVYTGAQIIKTERLRDINKTAFSLRELWDKYLAEQRVFGFEYGGDWCDVGRPECIAIAEGMLGV